MKKKVRIGWVPYCAGSVGKIKADGIWVFSSAVEVFREIAKHEAITRMDFLPVFVEIPVKTIPRKKARKKLGI